MADNNTDSTAKTLKIIIAVLAVVIVGMVVFLVMNNSKKEKEKQDLTEQKQIIETQLEDYKYMYAALKTDNDTLSVKLLEEQEKVEMLLERIKKAEISNRSQLKKYEDELGTLRAIMRNYVQQIDSLDRLNKELMTEIRQVKEDHQQTTRRADELAQRTTDLSSQVEKGAVLKARDVYAVGLNAKGKENGNSKRVEKIRVCFTLIENSLAEKGPRNVYLRVKGPDGIILAESEDNLFASGDSQLVYSAVREVDYQGEDIEMCIFCDTFGTQKGTYELTLYSGGSLIGIGDVAFK
ncbi:MAG: hypothetical protein LBG19_04350 [Prevotellaceae bacterium]|jgi:gamma-glutamylcyclotransferase (GGCT)/AIG2-like uncharacterized protein YtfP|nr:hypothetical protein [Prevotellaceae bacterium]